MKTSEHRTRLEQRPPEHRLRQIANALPDFAASMQWGYIWGYFLNAVRYAADKKRLALRYESPTRSNRNSIEEDHPGLGIDSRRIYTWNRLQVRRPCELSCFPPRKDRLRR
jgi:hypothetical protein